jgi:hypothetical protein
MLQCSIRGERAAKWLPRAQFGAGASPAPSLIEFAVSFAHIHRAGLFGVGPRACDGSTLFARFVPVWRPPVVARVGGCHAASSLIDRVVILVSTGPKRSAAGSRAGGTAERSRADLDRARSKRVRWRTNRVNALTTGPQIRPRISPSPIRRSGCRMPDMRCQAGVETTIGPEGRIGRSMTSGLRAEAARATTARGAPA